MTDLEWARAFVGCKVEGTGRRFNETVDVLVKKLDQVRQEGGGFQPPEATSKPGVSAEPAQHQAA